VRIRILGSGTSSGVPRIGSDWGACDPAEPRNRRTRASALVEHGDTRILIDTSPDLREQLLAADVDTLDAVIWTHDHADHCHGIDDLRQVFHAMGKPVRGFARPATLAVLESRFTYAFHGRHGYPSTIEAQVLPDRLTIGDITVSVTDQPHGNILASGLRFEAAGFAIGYATDFNIMTDDMMALYEGLGVWVVDALRRWPHPTHPELSAVLAWVEQLKPGRTALIHMDNSMDYAVLCAELPDGVEPGYDGLVLGQ
jgi:phosphoribosyl 1,2-cyclic phosphate phosphodiesterase